MFRQIFSVILIIFALSTVIIAQDETASISFIEVTDSNEDFMLAIGTPVYRRASTSGEVWFYVGDANFEIRQLGYQQAEFYEVELEDTETLGYILADDLYTPEEAQAVLDEQASTDTNDGTESELLEGLETQWGLLPYGTTLYISRNRDEIYGTFDATMTVTVDDSDRLGRVRLELEDGTRVFVNVTDFVEGDNHNTVSEQAFVVIEGDIPADAAPVATYNQLIGAIEQREPNIVLTDNIMVTRALDVDPTSALRIESGYEMVIWGNGYEIARDENADPFRLISVFRADLTLRNITLSNGHSNSGGCVFVSTNARFHIIDGTIENCVATEQGGGAIFGMANSEVIVDGSTLMNNQAETSGGAIFGMVNSQVIVDGSTLMNNQAETSGGAISVVSGVLTVNQTIVTNTIGNPAIFLEQPWEDQSEDYYATISGTQITNSTGADDIYDAGGIESRLVPLTILNSIISSNEGQGISIGYSDLIIERSLITNNTGSGISVFVSPSVLIQDSTVTRNTNGGLFLNGTQGDIINTTIANNTAEYDGGGISIQNTTNTPNILNITNSTIAYNRAGVGASEERWGHGIANYSYNEVTIINTILFNDNIRDCSYLNQGYYTGHNNLSNNTNCPGTVVVRGLAEEVSDNGGDIPTIALLSDSNAIDAGDPQFCPDTDQRGASRNGRCDIGAFEYNGIFDTETNSSEADEQSSEINEDEPTIIAIVNSIANIRQEANTNSAIVASASSGEQLIVVSEVADGQAVNGITLWYEVEIEGGTGYIWSGAVGEVFTVSSPEFLGLNNSFPLQREQSTQEFGLFCYIESVEVLENPRQITDTNVEVLAEAECSFLDSDGNEQTVTIPLGFNNGTETMLWGLQPITFTVGEPYIYNLMEERGISQGNNIYVLFDPEGNNGSSFDSWQLDNGVIAQAPDYSELIASGDYSGTLYVNAFFPQ